MDTGDAGRELARESLRYLYRILFLLYAEARPELGVLPVDDPEYAEGYSLARLGDLVARTRSSRRAPGPASTSTSRSTCCSAWSTTATASGAPARRVAARARACGSSRCAPTCSCPTRSAHRPAEHPGCATRRPGRPAAVLDTRLRNGTLHQVLRLLMLTRGGRKERGGFISYAQLGINQLGAVYEGLMSYTGFIAAEELYEVAKDGDPKDGSWMIPASSRRLPGRGLRDARGRGDRPQARVRYPAGSFVYRLAGRDRQTSASYYTPQSLTEVTVQLALKHRLDQDGTGGHRAGPARLDDLRAGARLRRVPQRGDQPGRRRIPAPPPGRDWTRRSTAEQYAHRAAEGQGVHRAAQLLRRRPQRDRGRAGRGVAVAQRHAPRPAGALVRPAPAPRQLAHRRRPPRLHGQGLSSGGWAATKDPARPSDTRSATGGCRPAPSTTSCCPPTAGARSPDRRRPATRTRGRPPARHLAPGDPAQAHCQAQVRRLQGLAGRVEFLWDLVVQRLELSEREISPRHRGLGCRPTSPVRRSGDAAAGRRGPGRRRHAVLAAEDAHGRLVRAVVLAAPGRRAAGRHRDGRSGRARGGCAGRGGRGGPAGAGR